MKKYKYICSLLQQWNCVFSIFLCKNKWLWGGRRAVNSSCWSNEFKTPTKSWDPVVWNLSESESLGGWGCRLKANSWQHAVFTSPFDRKLVRPQWGPFNSAAAKTEDKQGADLHFGWTCLSHAAAVYTGRDVAESSPPFQLLVSQAPKEEEIKYTCFGSRA